MRWLSGVLSLLVTVYLLVLVQKNPMLFTQSHISDKHTDDGFSDTRNALLTRYTGVTMQKHPATFTYADSGKTVHNYILHTLDQPYTASQKSPMHEIMILMGCYGDRLQQDISNVLESDFMRTPGNAASDRPAVFFNFMLQALEYAANRHNVNDETWGPAGDNAKHMDYMHDSSMCSCLRDFSAPLLMYVEKDNCDTYEHRKCSMQNLFDYTIDSPGQVVNSTSKNMLFSANSRRNKKDPIVEEIIAYENELKKKANYNTSTLSSQSTLNTFIAEYCKRVGYTTNSAPLKCPSAWATTAPLVSAVIAQMKSWAANMNAHNKLRAPLYNQLQNDISANTQLNSKAYQAYMLKYKAAYLTCARVGVPYYTTEVTGYTQAAHWYAGGQLLLLLAATVGIAFASYTEEQMLEAEMQTDPVQGAGDPVQGAGQDDSGPSGIANFFRNCCTCTPSLFKLLNWTQFLVIFVVFGFTFKAFVEWGIQDFDINATGSQFLLAWLIIIIILGILMALGFAILTCFTFCSKQESYALISSKIDDGTFKKNILLSQITQDLPMIVGLTLMAVGTTLQRRVSDYYLLMTVIILFLTLGVMVHISNVLRLLHLYTQSKQGKKEENEPRAQIVSLEDPNKMTSAFRPFFASRAELQQGEMPSQNTSDTPSTVTMTNTRIIYNRVIIGFLVAGMLFVFLNLAGLDVVQGQEFGPDQQILFAVVAFVIYTFGDLSLEFVCVFRPKYNTWTDYMHRSVLHKSKYTGYFILLGLLVLVLYQRTWACRRMHEFKADIDSYCNFLW